jgi:hypothetical protein
MLARSFAAALSCAATLLLTSPAFGQHTHGEDGHSDVEFGVLDGALVVDPHGDHMTDYLGRPIFEAEFEEPGSVFPNTDDPGFATPEDGYPDPAYTVLAPNAPLGIDGFGTLLFWNGSVWESGPATGEVLHVTRVAGPLTLWDMAFSATGIALTDLGTADGGIIGTAFGDGTFHQHIDFYLEKDGFGATPALSAYAIELQLFSPGLAGSQHFWLAFNNGMEHADFDAALGVLAVPEPGTYALMLAGLVLVAATRLRRKR